VSLRRATELLVRLERHALDQERLALRALESELAIRHQELAEITRTFAAEHAAAWNLPGGPQHLAAYLTREGVQHRAIREAANGLQRAVAQGRMGLQARLQSYKALELAAGEIAARDEWEQVRRVRAEVEEVASVRAAAAPIRTQGPASVADRRAPG
jgi:hypothetical protein